MNIEVIQRLKLIHTPINVGHPELLVDFNNVDQKAPNLSTRLRKGKQW